MLRGVICTLCIASCVAACDDVSVADDSAAAPTTVATAPKIGTTFPTPELAATIFGKVCYETAPSFAAAPSAIAAYPFSYDPENKVYAHTKFAILVSLYPAGKPTECTVTLRGRKGLSHPANTFGVSEGSDNPPIWEANAFGTGLPKRKPDVVFSGFDPGPLAPSEMLYTVSALRK